MVTSHPLPSAPRRDPFARIAWIALIAIAAWINATTLAPPQAKAQDGGPVIVFQGNTPTPALPTPALAQPVIGMEVSTPVPAIDLNQLTPAIPVPTEAPSEQPRATEPGSDTGDYLANVGAQAPHCIRTCDSAGASDYTTGPILYQPADGSAPYVITPNSSAPPADAPIAAAVPPLSADQAAVLRGRTSNGCPEGQTFYPRTGCHLPGSGGPQPGAVGQP